MSGRLLEYSAMMKRRWLFVAVGAFSLLLMGFVYGWSILALPLSEQFAWSSAQLSVVWMTSMVMFCFGGLLGSQITRRTSPRVTILIAALLLASGYLVSSGVGGDELNVLIVAYGVFVGGSTGMAHNATLSSVNRWFPDKVGTSSGMLTLGFGLGSLVVGTIAGQLIGAIGWQWSFRVIGLATAVVMLGASFCIRIPPPGQQLPPVPVAKAGLREARGVGDEAAVRKGGADGALAIPLEKGQIEAREYTTPQMLKQMPFYLTFIWTVMIAATYLSVMGSAKQIAMEVGALSQLATFMVGFISLFDGTGRLASGLFFDRFGYRPSLIGISLVYLAASVLLFVALSLSLLPMVFLGYMLIGLGFGSISTVLAAVTIRFYGQRNYPGNLAVVYMDFVPASIIGPPLVGFIETLSGSFRNCFLLLIAFSVLAIVLALPIRPPRYKD